MVSKKANQSTAPTTTYSFIGNIGCIRFPVPIRKASGIKRGDRLAITLLSADTIRLDKLEPPAGAPDDVRVERCACTNPPAACHQGEQPMTTVGWSYVQLGEALAFDLGFLPDSPIKIVAETAQITISLHHQLEDLEGVPHPVCPP
jgi:hypothetical protein